MQKITFAKGDGIGPEIMDATLAVLKAANARIEWEEIKVGEKVYLSGNTSGIDKSAWDSIRKNKIFLKAPITTPQGGGYKSLNVTMRKTLGLYSNVRPYYWTNREARGQKTDERSARFKAKALPQQSLFSLLSSECPVV